MDEISLKAYGKVNLGLDVTGKRSDGYHLVRMIMQTVDVWDDITITSNDREGSGLSVSCDNPDVPLDSSNLAYRAADIIRGKYGLTDHIHIDIKKNIPMAAGMAGGSADGAAVIEGMNRLFGLGMSPEQKDQIALMLGADVPFCLRRGTYLAEGIGEKLTQLPDLKHCFMVIVKPPISVSTAWAYRELDRIMESRWANAAHPDIDTLVQAIKDGDLSRMIDHMGNILEIPVLEKYDEIRSIRDKLIGLGASQAVMSGSGSAVFGVFESKEIAHKVFTCIDGGKNVKFEVEF